jgi:hypothetical protein
MHILSHIKVRYHNKRYPRFLLNKIGVDTSAGDICSTELENMLTVSQDSDPLTKQAHL